MTGWCRLSWRRREWPTSRALGNVSSVPRCNLVSVEVLMDWSSPVVRQTRPSGSVMATHRELGAKVTQRVHPACRELAVSWGRPMPCTRTVHIGVTGTGRDTSHSEGMKQ